MNYQSGILKNGEGIDHRFLKIEAMRKLYFMGCNVGVEIPLENNKKIDLIGLKRTKSKILKFGIECLTNPSIGEVKRKIRDYKDYFDKLYFAIYKNSRINNKIMKNIWIFKKTYTIKNLKDVNLTKYKCLKCNSIFYTILYPKNCPFCISSKLEEKDRFIDKEYKLLSKKILKEEMKDKYVNFMNIIILKNPLFIKDKKDGTIYKNTN